MVPAVLAGIFCAYPRKYGEKWIEFQVQPVYVVTCLMAYAWEGYSLDSASPYSDNTTVISIILGF